jgi:Chlorophyll A-B binding protein
MMKFTLLASIFVGAAAFSPISQKATTSTQLSASFESDIGATLPLGFFDPLGLVSDGDQEKFDRLRLVELKHGRISMLAVVGYLVQEAGYRLPGNIDLSGLKFADIPNGYAALETISYAGKLQIFAFIAALEIFVMRDFVGGEFPGDLRNNYIDFGWDTFDEETKLNKRTIELNQGRAAMMGILALMVHEQLGVSLIPASATTDYAF